jgi:energy-coupling factor transport system permease protein
MLSSIFFITGPLDNRIILGSILSLRFIILIGLGILFAIVTSPIEIPTALMQAKIPHRYGIVMMVAYRMMPIMQQKMEMIKIAQQARGANTNLSLKHISLFYKSILALIVPLIYAILELSVNMSTTLLIRGYNPNGRITIPPKTFDKKN